MFRIHVQFCFLFLCLFFFGSGVLQSSAQSESEQRALWIYTVASGTTWDNDEEIDTFKIAVFSSKSEYNALHKLAEDRKIKDRPVKVFLINNEEETIQPHIVFFPKNENEYLKEMYKKLKGKNILIIGDRSKYPKMCTVNFNKLNNSKKYNLNEGLAHDQKLRFSNAIKRIAAGSEHHDNYGTELNSLSDQEKRALWIFNIAYGITWPNESEIDTFRIGVFSSEREYCALFRLANVRSIKGRPVVVKQLHSSCAFQNEQIIFITHEKNEYAESVFNEIKCNSTLLFTDRLPSNEFSVINFNDVDSAKKFTINRESAEMKGLRVNFRDPAFTDNNESYCGKMLIEKNEEIQAYKEKIKKLNKILKKRERKIEKLVKENQKLNKKIKKSK